MQIIVITSPNSILNEASLIEFLIDEGVDRVHLRKPTATETEFRTLIESVPSELYSRLSTHDWPNLATEYELGGVHLNSRNPNIPHGFNGLISRSCHSLKEITDAQSDNYVFLSPIFDSISKTGYSSAFKDSELRIASSQGLITDRIIALGGVTPQHLPLLNEYGFGGAALLGTIWSDPTKQAIRHKMIEINKYR